jgi:hypothetical protein
MLWLTLETFGAQQIDNMLGKFDIHGQPFS